MPHLLRPPVKGFVGDEAIIYGLLLFLFLWNPKRIKHHHPVRRKDARVQRPRRIHDTAFFCDTCMSGI